MILGIGVDVFKVQRMEDAMRRAGDIVIQRAFTQKEIEGAGEGRRRVEFLATRFAGKEAIFKTFGKGWEEGQRFTDIEILSGENGEPLVILHGRTLERMTGLGAHIQLSLSCDTDYSIAFALLSSSEGA